MFTLLGRGIVFPAEQEPPASRIAYFTSLCPLASGAILCGFQNGASKHGVGNTARLCRSDDQGQTWRTLPTKLEARFQGVPGSLSGAELVEAAPGKLLLFTTWFDRSDPEQPLFDPVTEGLLRTKQLLAVSTDEGHSWSPWRELSTGELRGCASTGPAVRWDDGVIAYPFESFKEFDDPRPARHAAWVLVTRDGGASFSEPLLVAQHPEHEIYYWDQRLCAGGAPGEFTALFWTHHLKEQRDVNVHLRHGRITPKGISAEPIAATSLPGQIAAPLRLDDERLLAFVVDRGQPGTMTIWHSPDNGLHWPEQQKLVVHQHDERAALSQGRENIDFKQYWEDMGKWSFGHPAIRRLHDDTLLLAWYAGSPDCMSIHWAKVEVK